MSKFVDGIGLSYDDILIIPNEFHETIEREDISVEPKQFSPSIKTTIPIISSCMSTVTEIHMMRAMANLGGLGIHHRYCDIRKFLEFAEPYSPIAIGTVKSYKDTIVELLRYGHRFFVIDVAHGASGPAIDTISFIRKTSPYAIIVSGNVCTPHAASLCINAGASALRVGVGGGSKCITRIVTGCGVPNVTAIRDIKDHIKHMAVVSSKNTQYADVILIADGGVKNSGDIAKAIACGADYVMLGSMLAGTDESPGDVIATTNGGPGSCNTTVIKRYKKHSGMASKEEMMKNGKKEDELFAEGESGLVEYKGPVKNVIHQAVSGLKQAMFYTGTKNLTQFYNDARLMQVSNSSYIEGTAHGKA